MVYRCSISHSNLGGHVSLMEIYVSDKDYFCLLNCGNFYLFFMLGVFTTKYRILEKAKNANWLFSVCIVLYAVLFCVEMPIHALDSLNRHILMPFCMVFVIVTLFMARHGETSCFERILDYVGKRTLDVYVLHYFFISVVHLQDVGKYMEESGNSLLMFVLAVGLATVITALSVVVGNVLHKGRLIQNWFMENKRNNKGGGSFRSPWFLELQAGAVCGLGKKRGAGGAGSLSSSMAAWSGVPMGAAYDMEE